MLVVEHSGPDRSLPFGLEGSSPNGIGRRGLVSKSQRFECGRPGGLSSIDMCIPFVARPLNWKIQITVLSAVCGRLFGFSFALDSVTFFP